jgi:hypothetical protein
LIAVDTQVRWDHDQITCPLDLITEKFLGTTPWSTVAFISWPRRSATPRPTSTSRIIYATADDVVEPDRQSKGS